MVNRDLIKEALKFKYYLITVIAFCVGITLIAVFQAKTLAFLVDAVFLKDRLLNELWVWMSILLFLILLRAGFIWCNEVLSKLYAEKIKHDLRLRVQNTILSAGPVRLREESAGKIVNLSIEGIEALDAYFSEYLPQLAVSVLSPLLILFFALPADLLTGIIMLVTAPLIPMFMILIGKLAESMTRRQWETLSRLGGHFLDMIRGLPTLKIFGRSKAQSKVIYRISEEFRSNTMKVLRIAFLSALVLELTATISTAVIAVTLGLRLIYGGIHFHNALFLLLLVPEYYQPLRQLGAKFHAGMGGNAAAKDIFRFFKDYTVHESNTAAKSSDTRFTGNDSQIIFHNVFFRYENDSNCAVNNASFSLQKGKCTILTGPSGSGKSTLLYLLLGFIKPEAGDILLDGKNMAELSSASRLENIAYVSQHPYLFTGTIEENIWIGKPGASIEEVYEAARLAGAHDFIIEVPSGYKTNIGEGGKGLSGGQKQLIAIARAFLKDASILVMDEPTSNLDYEAEDLVSAAIEKLIEGRTVLLVTHHTSLMAKADYTLEMENGSIVNHIDALSSGTGEQGGMK